jgi:hypothetical protein
MCKALLPARPAQLSALQSIDGVLQEQPTLYGNRQALTTSQDIGGNSPEKIIPHGSRSVLTSVIACKKISAFFQDSGMNIVDKDRLL